MPQQMLSNSPQNKNKKASLFLLALAVLSAFAGNSLLARLAFEAETIDAASYSLLRLWAGAFMIGLCLGFCHWRKGKNQSETQPPQARQRMPLLWLRQQRSFRPSLGHSLALLCYIVPFSYAYLRLATATGALILFASVQLSMMIYSLKHSLPGLREIFALCFAFAGFLYLIWPGLEAPDPFGSFLMGIAGLSWAVYSIKGRHSQNPIGDTGRYFFQAGLILGFLYLGLFALAWLKSEIGSFILFDAQKPPASLQTESGIFGILSAFFNPYISCKGVYYALISGSLTSGLGYMLWYRLLPQLQVRQAGIIQLFVPVLAACFGVIFLGEALSKRLFIAGIVILSALGFSLFASKK